MSVWLNYFMIFIDVAAEFVVSLGGPVIIPTSRNVVTCFVKNSLPVYRTDSKDGAILSETIIIIICYALMSQLKYFERFVATSFKNSGACILKPPPQI